MGNPAKYAVWTEESYNLDIRRLAESLHSANLERRILVQLHAPLFGEGQKKRRV